MTKFKNIIYGLGIAGSMIVGGCNSKSAPQEKQPVEITKIETTEDIVQRIHNEYDSKYVDTTIISLTKDQFINATMKHLDNNFKLESYWSRIFNKQIIHPKGIETSNDFLRLLRNNSSYKSRSKERLKEHTKRILNIEIGGQGSITTHDEKYASKKKSKIFIFPEFIEQRDRKTNFGKITFSLEDEIREVYVHEMFQSEINSDGLKLDGKLIKKQTNKYTSETITEFIDELNIHKKTYEFLKKEKKYHSEFLAVERYILYVRGAIFDLNKGIKKGNYSNKEIDMIKKNYDVYVEEKQKVWNEYTSLTKNISIQPEKSK